MSLVAANGVRLITSGQRTPGRSVRGGNIRSVIPKASQPPRNGLHFGPSGVLRAHGCVTAGRIQTARVMCRTSPGADGTGDGSGDVMGKQCDDLPSRPKSILDDLDRESIDVNFLTSSDETKSSSRPHRSFTATAVGGAALFAAASLLQVGAPASAAPANASASSPSLVADISSAESTPKTKKSIMHNFAVYKEYSASEIFAYKIQKVFALPLIGKVMCLFVLTVPIIFVGGLAYKLADMVEGNGNDEEENDSEENQQESDSSFREKLKSAYFNLFDIPGADATTDETWGSGVVTQAIVFTGMFVFAVIIGIISDEIATKVEEVKTGNNKVIEKDHTVVVNWNSQLVPLLKQMAVAKSERAGTFDKPVVLLADIDKETMDELVEAALEDSPPLEVVTRRGNPFDAEDLQKVNAYDARRVVILHPHEKDVGLLGEGGSMFNSGDGSAGSSQRDGSDTQQQKRFQKQQREEALKATVVLNLLADQGRETFPDVIVQMPYRLPEKQDLVGHALKLTTGRMSNNDELLNGETFRVMDESLKTNNPYVQVHGSENTGKISAFAAFQPGTSRIFEELFKQSEDTPEFYLSHAPQFVGKTFGEAWRMLPNATLCGLSHADGSVSLAPGDYVVISPTDEVVMLSETSTVAVANASDVAGVPPKHSQKHYMRLMPSTNQGPMKLLFAGWNAETATALQLAQSMAPNGSEITVLSDDGFGGVSLKSTKNCKLRVVRGVPTAYTDLERAKVHEMDAVIIMPDHAQGKAEEDASVLATILQTRAVCGDYAEKEKLAKVREPHVVATLNTDSARSIVELMGQVSQNDSPVTPDVIMSDEIVGGALLQVAANPKLAGLFDALLATEGHEMYLRDADAFGGVDTRVADASGVVHEVTWGTLCERARERDELALGVMRSDGSFIISPDKNVSFSFQSGDRIVVLADQL